MAKLSRPRFGSLQFWPRSRARKILPSVNWKVINGEGILGIIAYKVGMASALVKDMTPNSMTINKRVIIPVTIMEVPSMKIFSIRFYKNGIVMKETIVSKDKELKRRVSVPKEIGEVKAPEGFDDVKIIIYSVVKDSGIKKTPDMTEISIGAENAEKKLEFAKSLVGKEISIKDFKGELFDVHGVTTGKGLSGPVQRFGISLKSHKSEKGVRRPGSLGPWHPARVTFKTPISGQLGMFTRVIYNLKKINSGLINEKDINGKNGFEHYGRLKTGYLILKGSVHGPAKRQVILTGPARPSKKQVKKKFEFVELLR